MTQNSKPMRRVAIESCDFCNQRRNLQYVRIRGYTRDNNGIFKVSRTYKYLLCKACRAKLEYREGHNKGEI